VDEDGWSGRLGVQYDLSDAVTTYLTYSRGYKGPAYNVFFNMQPRDTEALKPETSNTWEAGIKATGWNNRLTTNLAVFHSDYDNYQANFFDTVAGQVVTRLINAGSVSTEGVELDYALQATQQLKFSGALAYTRARIDQFSCPAVRRRRATSMASRCRSAPTGKATCAPTTASRWTTAWISNSAPTTAGRAKCSTTSARTPTPNKVRTASGTPA
jgi:outer membrane receptor protein involved in Fe transport